MNDKYTVKMIDLPHSVRGFSHMDAECFYTIVLNSRLSAEMQRKTYLHEVDHIEKGDFCSRATADQIEKKRHKKNAP